MTWKQKQEHWPLDSCTRSKNWNSINLEKFGGLWLRWGESHLISSLGGLIKTFEIQWCIFPESFKLNVDKMLGLGSPEDIYDDTFFVLRFISQNTLHQVFSRWEELRRISYLILERKEFHPLSFCGDIYSHFQWCILWWYSICSWIEPTL